MKKTLKDFWAPAERNTFDSINGQNAKTTHQNCIAAFGVARPGKTRRDKARN